MPRASPPAVTCVSTTHTGVGTTARNREQMSQVAPPLQGKCGQFCPRHPRSLSWQERKASRPLPSPPAACGMTIRTPTSPILAKTNMNSQPRDRHQKLGSF